MSETPDDDLKEKLRKIRNKLMEGEKLNVEAYRRYQVANEKLAGFLIEFIESQREKLKEKRKVGLLLGIFLRINDLRTQVILEYLSIREQPLKTLTMIHATKKMIEVYEQIRTDLASFFYHEDSKSLNLPYISSEDIDSESKLIQLNVCLGQLQGLVLGKLYEFVF